MVEVIISEAAATLHLIKCSAANRLIGEVVQSWRSPTTFKTLLRHYAKRLISIVSYSRPSFVKRPFT